MNAPLVLKDFHGVIEVTQDAWELKKRALAAATPIARVETPEQQIAAVDALKQLKEVRSGIEATRRAVKKPVLDLGRKIDDVAANYVAEVDRQYGRISGLINHYQREQQRVKSQEEEKLMHDAIEAARLREQAAHFRASGAHEEADRCEERAFELEMKTELAVIPATDKPKGLVVRNKINFQVIDAVVFCQAWPQFWKAGKNGDHDNECLTVDRMRVLDELNRPDGNGVFHMTRFPEELSQVEDRRLVQPAGLRVYPEVKSHLR